MQDFFEAKTIYKNNLVVFYHKGKIAHAPTIVLCHGVAAPAGIFAILYKYLEDYNYYEFVLPGHNELGYKKEDLNIISYAKLIANWIQDQHLKNVYLMGHSMGGSVVAIAENNLPKNVVSKLILLAPYNFACVNVRSYFALKILQNPNLLKRRFLAKQDQNVNVQVFSDFLFRYHKAIKILVKSLVSLRSIKNATYAFEKITTPTYLITAEKDFLVPSQRTIKHLTKKIKNLHSFVVPNASHAMFIDNPDLFMNHIQKILNNDI